MKRLKQKSKREYLNKYDKSMMPGDALTNALIPYASLGIFLASFLLITAWTI